MTSESKHFDLIVIGSGSAGSACWYAARRLGKSVAVFEGETLGGECPTYACVPTKALLHCAEVYETVRDAARFGVEAAGVSVDYERVKAWKDDVVSQTGAARGEAPYHEMGVTIVRQHARFVGLREVEAGGERYTAEHFLIATGSSQRVPPIPGLADAGYLTFKEAIDLTVLPGSLLVLGGGAVGCEFAHLFSAYGVAITIADRNDRLVHREDVDASDFLRTHLEARGVTLRLGASVAGVAREGSGKRVTLERDGRQETLLFDEILVATGKTPNLDVGLEAAGIEAKEDGIVVDETLRTTNEAVYAAGDVVGPYRFTHAASYQGDLTCTNMFTAEQRRVDYKAMPRCVFTAPEVAAVGLTEAEAREKGIALRIGRADMHEVDRAITCGQLEGFVKVLADAEGHLVGASIVAPRAGEMVQELALAIALGATGKQVAATVHAFPTYSEAVATACGQV